MVICLERGADLHTAQLLPLPLTVSCFSKIRTGFTFLVPAHLGSPGQKAVKRVCVCVCVCGEGGTAIPSFFEIKFYFKNVEFYSASQCVPRKCKNKH